MKIKNNNIYSSFLRSYNKDILFKIFIISTVVLFFVAVLFESIIAEFRPQTFYPMGMVVSLYSNVCLYLFIFVIFRKARIYFTKSNIIIVGILTLVAASLLIISCLIRRFLYFWDYTTYYTSCLDYLSIFSRGFFRGVANVWYSSNWDYSWFIDLFTCFFFGFTTKTNNAFCASLSLSIIVPFIVSLSGLILKLCDYFDIKDKKKNFALFVAIVSIVCVPGLFYSVYLSMPDMFGLVFAILIITLLVGYEFENKDKERYAYLLIATIAIIFTRRWYAFWVVSFWALVALVVIFKAIKIKDKQRFFNLLSFGISSIIIAFIFLIPMVIKFVGKDYISDYSSWKSMSLAMNFRYYQNIIGELLYFMVIVSFVYGMVIKKSRDISIVCFICFFLPLILFNVIQTADYHQLLILAPSLIFAIVTMVMMFSRIENRILRYSLIAILLIISFIDEFFFYTGKVNPIKIFSFTTQDLKRDDLEAVEKINDFIKDNSNQYGDIYMIPHNFMYNPTMFSYVDMPDRKVKDLLPYGADVVSAHDFPVEILSSKYVITAEPLGQEGDSIAPRIDRVVHTLLSEGVYSLLEKIVMENGYNMLILKREKACNQNEISLYIKEFQDLIEKYPYHYEGLISYLE